MFKYPYIDSKDLYKVSDEIDIDNSKLAELFNGETSIENIYADLLSNEMSLDDINSIFIKLISKKVLQDKINWKSDILSNDVIKKYQSQMETFSFFSQSVEEDSYSNLLYGLRCQEKLFKSKVHLFGNTILITELNQKLKQLGIGTVNLSEKNNIDIDTDILIFDFQKYDEDFLLTTLEHCNSNKIAFIPINSTNFGSEIGPFYISKETSCPLCLIDRKKAVTGDFYFKKYTTFNFNIAFGSEIIVLEIIKFLTDIAPNNLKNKVAHYNYITGLVKYHTVLKNPSCKICSPNINKPKRKLWEGII